MKKSFLAVAVIFSLGFATNAVAQVQTQNQSKAYNVYYAQDLPTVQSPEHSKKIEEQGQRFKDYALAINKNETSKAAALKEEIVKWEGENITWIDALQEASQKRAIHNWLDNAFKTLRISVAK